jgi:hypothetical protein
MQVYKVDPEAPREKGFLVFEWSMPLPDDGFADEEVIAKAHLYYCYLRDRNGSRPPEPDMTWPLSSLFTGVHDGVPYHLRHRGTGYAWRPNGDKDGSIPTGMFDRRNAILLLVESLIARVEEEGFRSEDLIVTSTRPQPAPSANTSDIDVLKRKVTAKTVEYDNAVSSSTEAKSQRARTTFLESVDRLAAELDGLEQEIADLSEPEMVLIELPPPDLEVGSLADLCSVLLDTAGQTVLPAVSKALARLIVEGTVEDCWTDDSPWATFSYKVRLQTTAGVRVIDEPITFEMGNTAYGPKSAGGRGHDRRLRRLADMRLADGWSIEDLAPRLAAPRREQGDGSVTAATLANNLGRAVSKILGCDRKLASALVDHPIDSTRAAVWAMATGTPMPAFDDLTPDERDRHLEVLWEAYLAPGASWPQHSAFLGGERVRREAARWISTHSVNDPDAGAPFVGLTRAMAWKSGIMGVLKLARSETPTGYPQGVLIEKWTTDGRDEWGHGTIWVDTPNGRRQVVEVPDEEKRLRIRMCPHCGTRTLLLPIPCPEGGADPVLCVTCLHTPDDPSHKLPRDYSQHFEGPRGLGSSGKKKPGDRGGTRIGQPPAMPSAVQSKRTRRLLRRSA